jgi:hypothetical protein
VSRVDRGQRHTRHLALHAAPLRAALDGVGHKCALGNSRWSSAPKRPTYGAESPFTAEGGVECAVMPQRRGGRGRVRGYAPAPRRAGSSARLCRGGVDGRDRVRGYAAAAWTGGVECAVLPLGRRTRWVGARAGSAYALGRRTPGVGARGGFAHARRSGHARRRRRPGDCRRPPPILIMSTKSVDLLGNWRNAGCATSS